MLSAVLTTVIGALCVAAILAAIKSRWLYLIAPKLYLNTPISDGQIISINIFNAGLTAEEDVAITFRQACKFELIGTSKSTLAVNGKTISLPKLSRLESITIVLLIEGKAFDPIDIESIESKSTKGKVVESKDQATALWQNFIALPVAFLALCVPFIFGTVVGADMKVSAIDYIKYKLELLDQSIQLAGFKTITREIYGDSELRDALKKSRIKIDVVEVVRRGDVLVITTRLSNKTKTPFMVDGHLKSSAGERGPVSFSETRIEDFVISPGEVKSFTQRAFLPADISTKIIDNRFTFDDMAGKSLRTSTIIDFQ